MRCTADIFSERLPDRSSSVDKIARSVDSDERMRQVMLVGHVVVMTQVVVLTDGTLPAHTAHLMATNLTLNVSVIHA